ncbi:transposase family protein [Streptomyces clavifer]|uniref:transposase family protein n=1 Tax=Streptomyces clavifer TaxID=68188 RepID=UPI003819F5E1
MPALVLSCSVTPDGDGGIEAVDPRARRGRRYPLLALVRAAVCAVAAGARSYAAIGHWLRRAPQGTLARPGCLSALCGAPGYGSRYLRYASRAAWSRRARATAAAPM